VNPDKYIEVVINTSYGGFGLSKMAQNLYKETNGDKYDEYSSRSRYCRHDPKLVNIVKELGEASCGKHSKLTIENIPLEFKDCYIIREYDGMEDIDLSPNLLIGHMIKKMNIECMAPEECKTTLLDLQKKLNTNFY
jgi:hypothetical protein